MMKSAYVIDGVVKLLAAIALFVFMSGLEDFFLSPRWIVITAALLLFLGAATEISYGVSRGEATYLKHIAIADAVFVGTALLAIPLALMGNPAGGFIWFGCLALGSIAIAIVFTTGANGPDFGGSED